MTVEELYQQISLGMDAQKFVESPLGKYLLERAAAEKDEALRSLSVVDPCDWKAVMTLQNIIHRAESFGQWLLDAIEEGRRLEREVQEGSEI